MHIPNPLIAKACVSALNHALDKLEELSGERPPPHVCQQLMSVLALQALAHVRINMHDPSLWNPLTAAILEESEELAQLSLIELNAKEV